MAKRRIPEIARRVARRSPKKRVLVVCEGSQTEPRYLKSLDAICDRAVVSIEVVGTCHTTPKELVEQACRIKKKAQAAARRSEDPNDAIEEVWALFDVDEHPKIHEAVEQATANRIGLAISNPCFEVWFLLHFEDLTAYVDRKDAYRRVKSHIVGYDKGKSCFEHLRGRLAAASKRAEQLAEKHAADGTGFPHNNPSCGVPNLVASLGVSY